MTFRIGDCPGNYACASSVSGVIIVENPRRFIGDRTGAGHEFGHVLGFHHFNNGAGNIMSYDNVGSVTIENVLLLWNQYGAQ
jgi:hypothetical protein